MVSGGREVCILSCPPLLSSHLQSAAWHGNAKTAIGPHGNLSASLAHVEDMMPISELPYQSEVWQHMKAGTEELARLSAAASLCHNNPWIAAVSEPDHSDMDTKEN